MGKRRSFAKFIEDVSIPDRCNCAPGEIKQKTWKLQNVGNDDWPAGFKAVVVTGDEIIDTKYREIVLPEIKSGEIFEVTVQVNVPQAPGRYIANFRLINLEGERFGPKVWVDFYVPEIVKSNSKIENPITEKSAIEIKYQSQLEELSSMGFTDTALNLYLLEKFEGKSERVVHWLLDRARSN